MPHRLSRFSLLMRCLLLLAAWAGAAPSATVPQAAASFGLNVWPQKVSVRCHDPIYLHIALQNQTYQNRFIRFWFTPGPFGPQTDLDSLLMRCFNRKTHKEVRYTWPPPGETADDAQQRESASEVYAHSFTGYTLNMAAYCDLPPGDYTLIMQYDTRYVPEWMQQNKQAWHGKTNQVAISIRVLPSALKAR